MDHFPDTDKARVCVQKNCTPLQYLSDDGACEDCMGAAKLVMTLIGCYKDVSWHAEQGVCRRKSDGLYANTDYSDVGTVASK